jgi:homoserine kinase type II
VLGALDVALAKVPRSLAPNDWRDQTLATLRPEITDLAALVAELTASLPDNENTAWFAHHVQTSDHTVAELAPSLPCQIVHGDLALSNLLAVDGVISGVLDWEIAGWDFRVNDVVSSLMGSSGDPEDAEWPARVRAFHQGYAHHVTLTDAERAAIPSLVRHGALATAVWRAGRWRRGDASLEEVAAALEDGALLDRHLEGYAG